MYLILLILGAGTLLLTLVNMGSGQLLPAAVTGAAWLTFLGIWKWKKSVSPETWNQTRFKYGRLIKLGLGVLFFAVGALQLGLVGRTAWANYRGEESHSVQETDIFIAFIQIAFGFALLGYEKIAAIIFMEFYFSTMLAGAGLRIVSDREGDASAVTNAYAFALAFVVVFALGQSFHWSKGFALAGLISVAVVGLAAYLTM